MGTRQLTYETVVEFLRHIQRVCVTARRDAMIEDDEIQAIRNEILHFQKIVNADRGIRGEFKERINRLCLDLTIKPRSTLVNRVLRTFSGRYERKELDKINQAFSIHDLEDRIENLLCTISKEDVFW